MLKAMKQAKSTALTWMSEGWDWYFKAWEVKFTMSEIVLKCFLWVFNWSLRDQGVADQVIRTGFRYQREYLKGSRLELSKDNA